MPTEHFSSRTSPTPIGDRLPDVRRRVSCALTTALVGGTAVLVAVAALRGHVAF